MRSFKILFAIVLLATVLSACGATPTPAPTAIPAAPPALVVKGMVNKELSLTMDQFKALGTTKISAQAPKSTTSTDYEGVLVKTLLDTAGVKAGAATVLFTASDAFTATVALTDLTACDQCMVALNGSALTMVMPGMPGKAWVKNVISLELK